MLFFERELFLLSNNVLVELLAKLEIFVILDKQLCTKLIWKRHYLKNYA